MAVGYIQSVFQANFGFMFDNYIKTNSALKLMCDINISDFELHPFYFFAVSCVAVLVPEFSEKTPPPTNKRPGGWGVYLDFSAE